MAHRGTARAIAVRGSLFVLILAAALFLTKAFAKTAASSASCVPAHGCVATPELKAEFNMDVRPEGLPRLQLAPATLKVQARVSTTATKPPPLHELTVLLDRHIAMDTKGLPVCHPSHIYGSGLSLRKACRAAIVGRGTALFQVTLPGASPVLAAAKLTAYNTGKREGAASLLVAGEVSVPTRDSVVIEGSWRRANKGPYGLEAVLSIPTIDGGTGSLINLALDLHRAFRRSESQASYVSASCSAGELRSTAKLLFENQPPPAETGTATTLTAKSASPCTGRA